MTSNPETDAAEGEFEEFLRQNPLFVEKMQKCQEIHKSLEYPDSSLPSRSEFASLVEGYEHPERVGPYEILDVLGEGGMGVVYLAEQKQPVHRRVALKVIKLGMDTKEVLARFEAERQALALMDHPNIARIYDAGATEEGRSYFTMDFVQGVPITEYCDRHKLSVKERLELFLQICHGVLHAHQKGIIHRDIKPTNILVSAPNDAPVAKIIDFGVAKATNQRLTERTLYTELGRAIGTPAYMSPEQAEFTTENIDHRTDVYSLGVLLYELLVGELPLDWESRSKVAFDEILRRIRDEQPPTPSIRWNRLSLERTTTLAARRQTTPTALRNELRGDLDWVCMKAIENERDRRYKTAAHLADDVERYLKKEPVDARPPSAVYRLRKYVRRNRTPVAALTVVFLALATGLVVSLFFYAVARKNEEKANRESERNLVLADRQRLADYQTEAADLWPTSPQKSDTLNQWIEKAGTFGKRLGKHQRNLTKLREQALPGEERSPTGKQDEGAEPRTWRFADTETEQRHEMLTMLVAGLQKFNDPDPEKGTLAAVRRRLELAPTREEHEKRWQEAIASVGNPEECPLYKGLKIEVVEGLHPIGRDSESQLWEFVHLRTGGVPERRDDGRLILTKETGLVFVLIPGGTFLMGAEKPSEAKPEGSPNVDPLARDGEGPVHEVSLSAFFVGKYEVRQCEWERVMGENPSAHKGDESLPVETVSWHDSKAFCEKLGFALPSEAQWEYACRAGTTSPYAGTGNLDEMGWYDTNSGKKAHPVGEKKPNHFGLCDMHGNVSEWCEDTYDKEFYSKPEAAGRGPVCTSRSWYRVVRGGCFYSRRCRSADRSNGYLVYRSYSIGCRPSRPGRSAFFGVAPEGCVIRRLAAIGDGKIGPRFSGANTDPYLRKPVGATFGLDFGETRTIRKVRVVPCLHPDEATYVATELRIEYRAERNWRALPDGVVRGNQQREIRLEFAPLATDAVRVVIEAETDDGRGNYRACCQELAAE